MHLGIAVYEGGSGLEEVAVAKKDRGRVVVCVSRRVVAICPRYKACYQKHYLSYLSPAHVFGNIYKLFISEREAAAVSLTVSGTFNVFTGIYFEALSQAVL